MNLVAHQEFLPILPAEWIKSWDDFTIKNEPITSIELMERASNAFCDWFETSLSHYNGTIHILCGNGNNGGDGLAIGRILSNNHFPVNVYVDPDPNRKVSNDWAVNFNKLPKNDYLIVHSIHECLNWKNTNGYPANSIIIDALFGSGLNRPLSGLWLDIVLAVNTIKGNVIKIAIDLPSGMSPDNLLNGNVLSVDHTVTFQSPKLCQLLPDTGAKCGQLHIIDIGLHSGFHPEKLTDQFYMTSAFIKSIIKKRAKFSHKGDHGTVTQYCGSAAMPGAALLSAKASYRAGCGYLYAMCDPTVKDLLLSFCPEVITLPIGNVPDKTSALLMGCGIGKSEASFETIQQLLATFTGTIILDADALNLLSENKGLLDNLPSNTILTPHPGEFDRLFGHHTTGLDRLKTLQHECKERKIVIVLKGAYTQVGLPDGTCIFNSTGNPGLAKAGTGDVLAGIIAGLAAQNYSTAHATLLGVFLHGLAADLAVKDIHEHTLMASDLLNYIGKAYYFIQENLNPS